MNRSLRPIGIRVAPLNPNIYPVQYAVVLNQYANFASVIDTTNDSVLGTFETGFYGEKAIFNANGTRLYITDRFKDSVRVFRVDAGPFFTQIGEVQTGNTDLERANPRDLDLSADGLCGQVSYVALNFSSQLSAANHRTERHISSRLRARAGTSLVLCP